MSSYHLLRQVLNTLQYDLRRQASELKDLGGSAETTDLAVSFLGQSAVLLRVANSIDDVIEVYDNHDARTD